MQSGFFDSAIADPTLRRVAEPRTFEQWTTVARELLNEGVAPDQMLWSEEKQVQVVKDTRTSRFRVPTGFVDGARRVFCHRSAERLPLLYRLLWRMTRGGERHLMDVAVDPDVYQFLAMEKSVRRDAHKMTAFVRFRKQVVTAPDGSPQDCYIAWHRPDHRVVPLVASFFQDRFAPMRWSILTPDESIHWDGAELRYGPGCKHNPIETDSVEDVWRTYYSHTFNPARANARLMRKELPVRHWATLPEAQIIPELLAESSSRAEALVQEQAVSAREFFPPEEGRTLETLRVAAQKCEACSLCRIATNLVFGDGPAAASLMLVGEQPGDQEDLTGRSFVGPAGQLLTRALSDAGVARDDAYITSAVKHFKHEIIGKKRIHRSPNNAEVGACRPWLLEQMRLVKPRVLVCMGVTAAQAVLGRKVTLRDVRGQWMSTAQCENTFVTTHPAAILRTMGSEEQAAAYKQFVTELREAASRI